MGGKGLLASQHCLWPVASLPAQRSKRRSFKGALTGPRVTPVGSPGGWGRERVQGCAPRRLLTHRRCPRT